MSLDRPLAVLIDEWRQKALTQQFTAEEYREIINTLRSGRISAGKAAVAKRSSKEPIDVGSLLGEIDDI